jgi:DNA-binding IscR family transcriptional regulator
MGDKNKCILECMVDKIDQNGLVVMSIRDISKKAGVPFSSVQCVVSRMKDEGFVEQVNKRGGVYRL